MSYIADAPISAKKIDNDVLLARAKLSDAEYNDWLTLEARNNFGLFRRQIRPNMIWGWWTQEVAWQLQRFYNEMLEGKRPKLAISAPPQHGKSWAATDFIAWVAGQMPDKKTIFGSYSDDLGVRTNNELQRIIKGEPFKRIFPDTKISEVASAGGYDRWKRNSSLIEFIGHEGSFRNTTVSGQINGLELHFGVIDDPLKGREEARRLNARNKVWDWFADDFLSRFAKDAALLVTMTRWDVDDLLGRYMERFPELRMLSYPAIAVSFCNGARSLHQSRRSTVVVPMSELRHYPRRTMTGGIEIVDRQFDFVRATMPYDYRYTCNAQQWDEAERICAALEGPMISQGVIPSEAS